jgi:tRNA-2-methylthio-N6-dimethylallyladenosine synthase
MRFMAPRLNPSSKKGESPAKAALCIRGKCPKSAFAQDQHRLVAKQKTASPLHASARAVAVKSIFPDKSSTRLLNNAKERVSLRMSKANTDENPQRRLFIRTYGCQMNVYDSARIADLLAPLGYAMTETMDDADLAVINTCHIREKASEKLFSELGRIRKQQDRTGFPKMVAVAGCVAQAEGAFIRERAPHVDLVLGPQSYQEFPQMIAQAHRASGERLAVAFDPIAKFDALPAPKADGCSAFVTVQEGCDKFCSFCVVPYTRGAEYSRPVDQVSAEVRALVAQGVREVTLLGQNVNAYRGSAPAGETGRYSLGQIVRHLARIDGLERIRFTTSHPRDMDDDLIAAFADCEALMPYLHLPVQSGNDRILSAMNRGHTVEHYLATLGQLRAIRPDIAISGDFIVGFPGETDAEFEDTIKLVEAVGYASAFSFKYSARPGTTAMARGAAIPDEVATERLHRLQALLWEQQTAFNTAQIGRVLPILMERKGRLSGQLGGRSPYLQSLHCDAPEALIGTIVPVRITGASQNSLTGRLTDWPARRLEAV